MGLISLATLGSANSSTANQTAADVTTTQAVNVGDIIVAVVAVDNNQTTDGDESAVASILFDSGGVGTETFTKGHEHCNGQGSAQAGATVSLWWLKLANNYADSRLVTTSFNNNTSRDKSAITLWRFAAPQTAALLHFDGSDGSTTFTDEQSGSSWTAIGTPEIDTAQSKFGGSSVLLNSTSNVACDGTRTRERTTFGTADFTIDFWVRFSSLGATADIMYEGRPAGTDGFYPTIYKNTSNKLIYFTNGADRITGTTTLTTDTWYHVALTRSGTSTRLFLDGTQEGSTYSDSNTYVNPSVNGPRIGGAGAGTNGITGWIDEFRAIRGLALWTANFTPPSSAGSLLSYTISETGTSAGLSNDGADPGSLNVSDTANVECLRIRGIAAESNSTTALTQTTNWTVFTATTTSGGGSAGNMGVRGEWRISTGTGDASDPTLFSADCASAYFALQAVEDSDTSPTAGSATGTCTVSGVGQSRVAVPGTTAGTCTVSGVGTSRTTAVGSAAGACTVSATSLAMLFMVGAAAGTCTVTGVAQSLTQTVGSAAGTCTVTGVGASTVPVAGSAAGTCNVTGVAESTVPVTGSAAGTCVVTGIAFAQGDETTGSAAGTCTVTGIAVSTVAVVGSVAGTCTVAATAQSLAQTVGSVTGTCTVTGIGVSLAQTAGAAAGTCTVSGVTQSGVPVVGSAAGTCTVSGTAQSGVTAVGSAAGTCTVSGVAVSLAQTTGNAAGTCTVTGVGAFTGGATETAGSAAGTCTVEGVAQSTAEAVGNASGTCTVTGVLIDANSAADPGPTVGSHNHFFITMGKMGWIKRAA